MTTSPSLLSAQTNCASLSERKLIVHAAASGTLSAMVMTKPARKRRQLRSSAAAGIHTLSGYMAAPSLMRPINETDLIILLSWVDRQPRDRIISIVSPTYGPLCGYVPEEPVDVARYVLSDRWFDPYPVALEIFNAPLVDDGSPAEQ